MLLGAFVVTSATLLLIRPTNVVQSFLHQSSFYNKLPHHTLCRSHVLCRPFLPIDWLVSKASSSHLRADHPHFHGHLPFKKQGVPLRVMPESRVSHITAAAGPLTCLHGTHLHGLQKSASLFFHVLDGIMQLTVTPVPWGLKKSLISATSTPRCVSSAANFFRPPSSHAFSSKKQGADRVIPWAGQRMLQFGDTNVKNLSPLFR